MTKRLDIDIGIERLNAVFTFGIPVAFGDYNKPDYSNDYN